MGHIIEVDYGNRGYIMMFRFIFDDVERCLLTLSSEVLLCRAMMLR